ncbi:MAG: hypothetical protein CL431_08845 [Acidimicrobiaceae bacterium]|nr:hypothetical protein [Acidimicrobiaceae bacterium]
MMTIRWNNRLKRHNFTNEDLERRFLVLNRLVFQFGRDNSHFKQIHAIKNWNRLENTSAKSNLRKLRDIRSGKDSEQEIIDRVKRMSDLQQAIYFDHNALGTDCGCISTINIHDPNNYVIISGVIGPQTI